MNINSMENKISVTLPVEKQFAAYNAHDLPAFLACFLNRLTGLEETEKRYTVVLKNNERLKSGVNHLSQKNALLSEQLKLEQTG